MFEKASRQKLRFDSARGQLSVEDLWDLPLTSNTRMNSLDDVARSLHKQLNNKEDVSFVEGATKSDPTIQLKFDLVKHIIDVRQLENAEKLAARSKAEDRQKIMAIIAAKKDEKLQTMTLEELEKLLA